MDHSFSQQPTRHSSGMHFFGPSFFLPTRCPYRDITATANFQKKIIIQEKQLATTLKPVILQLNSNELKFQVISKRNISAAVTYRLTAHYLLLPAHLQFLYIFLYLHLYFQFKVRTTASPLFGFKIRHIHQKLF